MTRPKHCRSRSRSGREEPGVFRTVILVVLCCLVLSEPVLLGLVWCDVPAGRVETFVVV